MTNPKVRRNPAPPAPLAPSDARLLALLQPRLDRLAEDAWQLARRSPALAVDPAVVAGAAALLADLRRLLRHEPGLHLLPPLAPARPIGLHALALALRQSQAALAAFAARHLPPVRSVAEEIDAINRMTALYLRDTTQRALAQQHIPLPPDLRLPASPQTQPPLPDPPPGRPPAPKPHIRRLMARRRNGARRTRRAG